MKILRVFGFTAAIFLLMGVVISTRPIVPSPRRVDSPAEERSLKKPNYVRVVADAVESAVGLREVPEWVRSDAMKSVTNTSLTNSVKALSAWRQRRTFVGSLDERSGRVARRPSPYPPDEPGDVFTDNDWTNDHRANNDASGQQFHPAVCVGSDGTIYVTWCRNVDSENSWVYFSKSTDGGDSWISPVAVRTYGINNRPRIACYGTGSTADVYITYTYWYDPSEYDYDIYCGVSNNGGSSFTTWAIQQTTSYEDMGVVTTDDAGYVYIALCYAWVEGGGCDPDEAESEIMMYRSTTHGASWSSGYYLTNYGGQQDDILPALATHGGGSSCILHFSWVHDNSTSGANYNVYYKRILNAGSSPSIPSTYVSIASSGYQEYVIPGGIDVGPDGNPQIAYVYSTSSNGNGDVRYRRSNDGGISFLSYKNISSRNTEEIDPAIAVDDQNNPTVVWRDARAGNCDIYVSYSDDQGTTWKSAFKANQDATTANQYWPGVGMWKDGWRRNVAVTWWDERYDDGDVYFNGNEMVGVAMDVDYIPTMPLWPLPGFSYHAFEAPFDTTFLSANLYQIWFDPEYSNDPLLDELWAGSSSSERWAVDNPGGWEWLAGNYYTPPDTGGSYDCAYYHQYKVIFDAVKGNPPECGHTLPNIDVDFTSFGNVVDTTVNDEVSCTVWVDMASTYRMSGWYELSPIQRWATNSPDTVGSVSMARVVQPYYYHQWLPVVLFVGPTSDNTVFTENHTQFGAPHMESGLYDRWEQWTDCGTMVDFSDTTVPEGWYAIDTTYFLCEGYSMRTIRYSNNTHVVVRNDFGYGQIDVDGTVVPSPDSVAWGPGSVHDIAAISPQTFGDTIRYIYREWSDGGASAHSVTVPDYDIDYIAYFDRKYKLDMTYSGSTGGHIPTLDGEGWYWEDSLATITASEYWDSAGGVRYGFSHWETIPEGAFIDDSTSATTTIVMNKHYTVCAVYSVQYELLVSSSGGYGSPDPPVGASWIDAGAHICAEAGSPDTVAHMFATGWIGSGPVPASGSGDVACFYMSAPGSIQWLWDNQLTLTIISAYGIPEPTVGVHYYDPGDYVECSVETPFALSGDTRAACIGYSGTSIIGSGAINYVDFNIAESCTLTWNWQIEYKLIIINSGGFGEPLTPPAGENWFPSGGTVMAKVTSPDPPMVCIGFNGTPPTLPLTSAQDSIVFSMIAPATLDWQWASEYEVYSLTVISPDGHGAPTPYGTTWWLPGSSIDASVTSPWPDPAEPGVRWVTDGYDGTGSAPTGSGSSTGAFFIWDNSTITWNWHDEYELSIASEPGYYGAPDPDTGSHWFEGATSVSGSVTTPWEDSVVCTGFTGTGSAPATSGASSFSFTLTEPSSVTWQWNISTVELIVESAHGTPAPSVGSHRYALGTWIDLSVEQYDYTSPVERWKCIGWTGTGSVPPSGADTTAHVHITDDSSIRWLWVKQIRLDVDNPGGYDTPVPAEGQHWFDEGSWVSCYITTNPVDTMFCVGFYGTGDCPSMWGVDEVSFVIDNYSTIQWVWLGEGSVNVLDVISEHGEPHPAVGTHYYPDGVSVDCYMLEATDTLAPGDRVRCVGFDGTGSVPSGTDTSFTFTIDDDGTLTWNWQREFSFEIDNPTGLGHPSPAVGTYWYVAGSEVVARITVNPDGTMACIGYSGWGSLGSGISDYVDFDITEPSGVQWIWEDIAHLHTLTVVSPYEPCDPPIGINYIPDGTSITATAGPFSYESDVLRHKAVGWTGVGCVPPAGDTNATTFIVDSDGVITWDWDNEYYIALTYTGCGGAAPIQSGEGWFGFREIDSISTSTSVDDGGAHYGFFRWVPDPASAVSIAEDSWPATTIEVAAACTLTAQYRPAVACSLVKYPDEEFGGFVVDGTLYDGISEYVDWWALGSTHRIGATSPDTGLGARFLFVRWSDAGAATHDVGPITESVAYRAFYITQYRLRITKSPYHTSGHIAVDGTSYSDSGSVSLWLAAGASPTVGVSDVDYESVEERFNWTSWSDGGALNHLLEPMGTAVNLTANYDRQYRLKVAKIPPEAYGSITIDDSLYEFVSSAARWFVPGGEHDVDLSNIDVAGDSAYQFSFFDGDPSDTILPKVVALSAPESLTAYYRAFEYVLSIDVYPTVWDIGMQVSSYVRTMFPSEMITVENTGNIDCDLGMAVNDTLSSWVCGCTNGMDKIVIRGHFDNNPVAPAIFNPAYDCIRETINWSSNIAFGPLGYALAPSGTVHLWLQSQAPRASSDNSEQTIIVNVRARVSLY